MRVLIVAYYFPPKGGAGTQRFAKFCKYLPEHGVEPVVLTVEAATRSEHAPHDDASLLAGGDCRVERVAVPASVPASLRMRRKLRLQLDEDEWAHAAAQRAGELARQERFDAVVTTLSPYACYRIGARLQRQAGLPWVVDLRDPWALDAWRVSPTAVHALHDLRHFRRAINGADFVVANVPEARREFLANGVDPRRCVVIPNGFDEDDFDDVTARRSRPDEPLRLVHIGTFHPADLPAGMTRNTLRRVRQRQIEPLGRTGFYLLHAVAKWRDRVGQGNARQRLAVNLYGQVDPSHRDLIDRLGIADLVTVHGYVAHAQSIAALLSSDAVFVPLHGIPAGERALVVPGKLYEALASERPVLAALPPGDGADLVRALDAGIVVPPTDVDAITVAITDMVEAHRRAAPLPGCARSRLHAFRRRGLTKQFAQVLEGAAAKRDGVEVEDAWIATGAATETA